eukprot:7113792-Alexandrium_andersonii.AAC.1
MCRIAECLVEGQHITDCRARCAFPVGMPDGLSKSVAHLARFPGTVGSLQVAYVASPESV